jgi:hypothetical protein
MNFLLLEFIFFDLCGSSNGYGTFFLASKTNYLGSNVPLASWASIFQCDQSLKKKTMFHVIDHLKIMSLTLNTSIQLKIFNIIYI